MSKPVHTSFACNLQKAAAPSAAASKGATDRRHPWHAKGFSLIELMIVVAIVAVLTALAVNSYIKYAQSSRRTDAYSALAQTQGMLERCYQQTYAYGNAYNGGTLCTQVPTVSPQQFYTIAVTAPAGSSTSTYLITAKPQGAQASDTACASITLDYQNNKGSSPSAASVCWQN